METTRILALTLVLTLPSCGVTNEQPAARPSGSAPVEQRSRAIAAAEPTPLDRYVREPDSAYAYHQVAELKGEGYTGHVLEMTSQRWRGADEVDRNVWKHWLTIVVPERVSSTTGLLYLTGGKYDDPAPDKVRSSRRTLALATGSVVAELRMVPNQPLIFAGETEPRKEDALIAYGWDRFLRTDDPTWLPRLPMTKAAVRGMDTVSEFCAGEDGGGVTVDKFVVAGRSKRGWTTWTTAAVDDRVVAIVPIVIDLLNLEASFTHHYRAYGFWAPAIRHYVDIGIPDWFGTEEMKAMRGIVEPYEYRARLTMPKFLLNAAGDEFFQPDSSRFYFEELLGEKYLRYVPNTGHSLSGSDALESFLAFYGAILDGTGRPEFSWSFESDGSIVVRPSGSPPSRALLWQATNPEARDFRIDTLGAEWTRSELAAEPDGSYVARVAEPAEGWTAFLVELTYPSGIEQPFKFTTAVRVVPDTLLYSLDRDP